VTANRSEDKNLHVSKTKMMDSGDIENRKLATTPQPFNRSARN